MTARRSGATNIVIGKPEMPTPLMTADMKYITHQSDLERAALDRQCEYLPALAAGSHSARPHGIEGQATIPDGSSISRSRRATRNALGRIRFNFPNKFLVYQHDTPDKILLRVRQAGLQPRLHAGAESEQHYAEVFLSLDRPNDGYTEDRIKKMIALDAETDIQLPTYIPVNLTYQTAFVDDAGKLEFRDDVYGRDKR